MANRVNKKEFAFTWKIENYSICNHKTGKFIQSPIFSAECLSGNQWFLNLFPRGASKVYEDYISCYLWRTCDANVENIIIDYNFEILKPNGDIFYATEIQKNKKLVKNDYWYIFTVMKINELNNEMKKWYEDTLIIRCNIKCENPKSWYEAKTTIDCNRCNYSWNISNIKFNNWTGNKSLSFVENSNLKIQLSAPENKILIHISESKIQYLKCKITLNINEVEHVSKTSFYSFSSIDDVWEFPSFITKNIFLEKKNDETFCLKFEFIFSNGNESMKKITTFHHNPEQYFSKVDTVQCLRDDLNALFHMNKHADVKFQVDGQIFEAHKNILSARSPVFCAMFDQEMAENKTGIIEIIDIDPDILKCFLKFLYTGTVGNREYETALKLLTVGHKYQVPSLEDSCSDFLVNAMSIENAYDILVAADMIGHKQLKESALDFVKSNASEIMSSPTWPELMEKNLKLGFEILSKLWVELKKEVKSS